MERLEFCDLFYNNVVQANGKVFDKLIINEIDTFQKKSQSQVFYPWVFVPHWRAQMSVTTHLIKCAMLLAADECVVIFFMLCLMQAKYLTYNIILLHQNMGCSPFRDREKERYIKLIVAAAVFLSMLSSNILFLPLKVQNFRPIYVIGKPREANKA